MLLHPEIQRKAQAEIDAVVGSTRLPDFSDRRSLPYLKYVLQETLRRVHSIVCASNTQPEPTDGSLSHQWVGSGPSISE